MKKSFITLFLLSMFLYSLPANAANTTSPSGGQSIVEQVGKGSINWSDGIIRATGIGAPPQQFFGKPNARPMALRAGKMDAYRNILEVVRGVRISAASTVQNYSMENDTIMGKVEGMIRGAKIVNEQYMSDGTVEVTLEISMRNVFADTLLPEEIRQIQDMNRSTTQTPSYVPSLPAPAPATVEPEPPVDTHPSRPPKRPSRPAVSEDLDNVEASAPKKGKVYTGMVVDARGLSAKPAMAPKILDENGQEVYGSASVSREYAVQQGMTGYAKSIDAAKKNERVANNPLVVKGVKIDGPERANVVISNSDAADIRNMADNLSFMKKCRVMIVVD